MGATLAIIMTKITIIIIMTMTIMMIFFCLMNVNVCEFTFKVEEKIRLVEEFNLKKKAEAIFKRMLKLNYFLLLFFKLYLKDRQKKPITTSIYGNNKKRKKY